MKEEDERRGGGREGLEGEGEKRGGRGVGRKKEEERTKQTEHEIL